MLSLLYGFTFYKKALCKISYNRINMKTILSIDIGTTNLKAGLYDELGNLVHVSSRLVQLKETIHGEISFHPDTVLASCFDLIKEMLDRAPNEDVVLSLGSAMHTFMILDAHDRAVSECLIFSDQQAKHHVEAFCETYEALQIFNHTGTPLHTMSWIPRILWLKAENKLQASDRIISFKEYLLLRWFDQRIIDVSVAASSGLLNIHTHAWHEPLLEVLGIEPSQLSRPVPITHHFTLEAHVFKRELTIVVGASDGPLSSLGTTQNDQARTLTVGTSGAIRRFSKTPILNPKANHFCYAFSEDHWIVGGPTNNGGNVIEWAMKQYALKTDAPYDKLAQLLKQSTQNDLIFLPYLFAERAPLWSNDAKGLMWGLTHLTTADDQLVAIVEGITMNLKAIANSFDTGNEPLYVSGGLSKIEAWVQLLANIFGTDVFVDDGANAALKGAYHVARAALGLSPMFTNEKSLSEAHLQPQAKVVEHYLKKQQRFETLLYEFMNIAA